MHPSKYSSVIHIICLVALIAEDEGVKKLLASNGIESQTVEEVAPVRILPAKCLVRIYNKLGNIFQEFF